MSRLRRRYRARLGVGEQGQTIVLFTLMLVVILAMAGLLLDGGQAWANRRQAQNAADTAALAAAKAVAEAALACGNGVGAATAAAQEVAALNGFTDVEVHYPPTGAGNSAFNGDCDYLEVRVSRVMETTFSRIVGQTRWDVGASAVANIRLPSVAKCNFCSLNDSDKNHTLLVKLGSQLTVDGTIYVNSSNAKDVLEDWFVYGDGFDIFGTGGRITAETIQVVGGWETHDAGIATAQRLAGSSDDPPSTCAGTPADHPEPPAYAGLSPTPVANVCINQPVLVDPLADFPTPDYDDYPTRYGSPGAPSTLTVAGGATLDPGVYWGGIAVSAGTVTLNPGVYIMAGGGFTVSGSGSIDAPHVMIYNSSGSGTPVDTGPGVDLTPPDTSKKESVTTLSITPNPATSGSSVTLTAEVKAKKKGDPAPTGSVAFYDGQTPISGCGSVPLASVGGKMKATCTRGFAAGTHVISAIYDGNATFDGSGDALTLTVNFPTAAQAKPVTVATTGTVVLGPLGGGAFAGMTIFNDRGSSQSITLNPNNGAQCAFTTSPSTTPQGCIGGLSGTVYAANDLATTIIKASGTANLQVISGKILLDNGNVSRFTYIPSGFANGQITLVE